MRPGDDPGAEDRRRAVLILVVVLTFWWILHVYNDVRVARCETACYPEHGAWTPQTGCECEEEERWQVRPTGSGAEPG